MPPLRFCSARDYPLFLQKGADGRFIGLFAPLANDVIHYIEKRTNDTLEIRSENDGLGGLVNPETGMWDGCIGLIQRNESDMLLQFGDYPHLASYLKQGLVLGDSVITFIAAYTSINDVTAVQIESFFATFDPSVWLLSLITLLAGYSFLLLGRFLYSRFKTTDDDVSLRKQSYRRPLYQVITHFTDYGQLADAPCVSNVIFNLALSLFPLLVIFHLCSFIKTELDAVRPPQTFRSYRDLINNNVSLAILRGWDYRYNFELAPKGSERRALWDLSLRRYPQMEFMFNIDLETMNIGNELVRGRAALITDSLFVSTFMKELCLFAVQESTSEFVASFTGLTNFTVNSLFPLSGRDVNEKATLKGFIFSEHFAGSAFNNFRSGAVTFFEMGLVEKSLRIIDSADAHSLLPTVSQKKHQSSGQIEECTHNVLYQPQIIIEAVALVNIRNLLIIVMLLYLISFYVFLCEVNVVFRKKKNQSRVRPHSR